MTTKSINIGLGTAAFLGAFFAVAAAGNLYATIGHLGGLAYLLYPIPLALIGVGVLNVYKAQIPHLRAWHIVFSSLGLVVTLLTLWQGIGHVNAFVQSSYAFEQRREVFQREFDARWNAFGSEGRRAARPEAPSAPADLPTARPGLGAIMMVLGYGGVLGMTLLRRKEAAALVLAAALLSAGAGTAEAGNAAPFGMELGAATCDQVKEQLGASAKISADGVNYFTEGPMLTGTGDGLGIEGLKSVSFICTKAGKLDAVLMTLGKSDFDRMLKMLTAKYRKPVRRVIPFVGDKYAEFRQGATLIQLSAPHMSFDMTLIYMTRGFQAAYKARTAADKAQKDRRQANQL